MSGVPRIRSMNMEDIEQRSMLVSTGNKDRTAIVETRKPAIKPHKKVEKSPKAETNKDKKQTQSPTTFSPSILKNQHGNQLLRGNLSLNASCSSDASSNSSHSRASMGRICRSRLPIKRKQRVLKLDKVKNVIEKVEKLIGNGNGNDGVLVEQDGLVQRKRCSWVTSNTGMQLHWLIWGYLLEFKGKNVWIASLLFLVANTFVVVRIINRHKYTPLFQRVTPAMNQQMKVK